MRQVRFCCLNPATMVFLHFYLARASTMEKGLEIKEMVER